VVLKHSSLSLADFATGTLDQTQSGLAFEPTARAMVARPLTRLTLRLARMDWWTWGDSPDAPFATQRLRLDPSTGHPDTFANASQPTMHELAEQRRAGKYPPYGRNWGAIVCSLPDLKIFELVLETWEVKKQQLDVVVECARTWKFPLAATRAELIWDKTETANWKRDEGDEEDFVEEQASFVPEDNHAWIGEDDDEYDEDDDVDDEFYDSDDDLYLEQEEDGSHGAREATWSDICKEFEVRVVRFKRRTVA
jgi:hypothetical protein